MEWRGKKREAIIEKGSFKILVRRNPAATPAHLPFIPPRPPLHPPPFYLTLYISIKTEKSEGEEEGGGGEEAEEDPVKLNSFPPSLKRSHGGHDSTLPSGSLKLLISFSYSNDFLSPPCTPSASLLRAEVSSLKSRSHVRAA